MATKAQAKAFIKQIGPIIQKLCREYGYHVASPIIAQACCESAYGTSWISVAPYWNFFGMKCGGAWTGRSVSAKTKEEYQVGTLTTITANFRAYDSMEEGLEGYFQFIKAKRYQNLHDATTPEEYLKLIKADGYATSDTYASTNLAIVNDYNLRIYDDLNIDLSDVESSYFYGRYTGDSNSIIMALEAIGETDTSFNHRKDIALSNGFCYYSGTSEENLQLVALIKKGILKRSGISVAPAITDQLIDDVIAGKYGNGSDRKRNLEALGYDYSEVQALVNAKLKG